MAVFMYRWALIRNSKHTWARIFFPKGRIGCVCVLLNAHRVRLSDWEIETPRDMMPDRRNLSYPCKLSWMTNVFAQEDTQWLVLSTRFGVATAGGVRLLDGLLSQGFSITWLSISKRHPFNKWIKPNERSIILSY